MNFLPNDLTGDDCIDTIFSGIPTFNRTLHCIEKTLILYNTIWTCQFFGISNITSQYVEYNSGKKNVLFVRSTISLTFKNYVTYNVDCYQKISVAFVNT